MKDKLDTGAIAEIVGFLSLVIGVGSFSIGAAAIVGGVLLIVFGGVKQ